MGIYALPEIQKIILNNPNKLIVQKGKKMNSKLMMHLHGQNIKDFMKREDYFENTDVYKTRAEKPTSNRDLFQRVLQEESMIFAARGGSSHFNLPAGDEKQMNEILANVRYGMSLRAWMQNFGLPAYRSDPMGVFFMETEVLLEVDGTPVSAPKVYPTYKSIQSVFDYEPNGRRLEYVCFQLTVDELVQWGIVDTTVSNYPNPDNKNNQQGGNIKKLSPYFRFVDDEKDIIVKKDNNVVMLATNTTQKNPIKNTQFGGKLPAFIISDLLKFDDPNCFASPVSYLVELADSYLYDRSIRDLQKKYHGFAKAIEPILKCSTCNGEGLARGSACPDCTIPGQSKGTGYKLKTKVSDVAKFPMDIFEKNPGFAVDKLYTYVVPPIQTWDKQDLNLDNSEGIIYFTYWGCSQPRQTTGPSIKDKNVSTTNETATKTVANLKPKYARLNQTADWVQNTENIFAWYMGLYYFGDKFKGSSISISRNYILETAEELIQQYYDMRQKGAPDFVLDEQMIRYLNCQYQDNPLLLVKFTKLFDVDPFPHDTPEDIDASGSITVDLKLMKWYFGEWCGTLQDMYIIDTPVVALREALKAYVQPLKVVVTGEQKATAEMKAKANAQVISTAPTGH